MNEIRQFRQNKQIANGITAATNLKMFDIIPGQHENLATNTNEQVKISIAQTFCEPVAVCSTNNPPSGQYTATCVNFPDFAVSFVDSDSVRHSLIGLKLRVVFEHGITYGSVAAGTFPTLSVNGSEALPLLAQGKTMAQGAIVAGQSVEFTIIPYGNSIAFDADSNVRESTNDYTIYTDGRKSERKNYISRWVFASGEKSPGILSINTPGYNDNPNVYIENNKIRFRTDARYLLIVHIAGRTGNTGRLFVDVKGSNLTLHGISYGDYAEVDIVVPTQINNNSEIYVNLNEAFTVDGGQIESSYIALSPL